MTEAAAPVTPADSPPSPPASRRRIRWLLKLALLAGVFYLVGGFWLTPWLARQAIEHYGSAALKRSVQVVTVRFDPFTATLTAEDVRIGERSAGDAALRVARVRIDLEPLALASGQVVLRALDIEQPVLRIARTADGALNWGDLWPRPPATDGGIEVVVQDVRLRDGRVLWLDDDAEVIAISAIELDLPALDRLQRGELGERTPYLAARIGDQQLAVQGEPHGGGVRFALALDDVDLAPWARAARIGDERLQGRLDARLALDFAAATRFDEHLTLSGTLKLRDAALHSADARLGLEARAASLTLGDSHPLQHRWHVRELALDAPQVRYVVERSNVDAADAAEPPASSDTPAPVAEPMQLRIDTATIRAGRFEYVLDERRQLVLQKLDADWQQPTGVQKGELRATTLDEHGARLSAHATLDLALREAIVGEATLDALTVPHYAAWLAPLAPGGEFAQGRLAATTRWQVQHDAEGWQWAVSGGKATLADAELRLRERAAPPLLRLRSLDVGEVAIDSAARMVRLDKVRATAPRLAVRRTAAGFDFAALRPPAEKAKATPAPTPAAPAERPTDASEWQVKTGAIRIADGEIDLEDRRQKPTQRSRLQGIALNVADVTALENWWRKVSSER